MTSLANLPDTLRSQFIASRNRLDIAQDWLVKHAPEMIDVVRTPWINALVGGESLISVNVNFRTRTEAVRFGRDLGQAMEEGSSYFDVHYPAFTVHLHYTSSI